MIWRWRAPLLCNLCRVSRLTEPVEGVRPMWQEYNPNPAGRRVGDCSVRAIAKALDVDWETAYMMIAVQGYYMRDMPSSNAVWGSLLRQNGFTREAIPTTCPDCYTIADFAKDHPTGLYVVGTGNHVVTLEDGTIYDSWHSENEIPQYFWRKDEAYASVQ